MLETVYVDSHLSDFFPTTLSRCPLQVAAKQMVGLYLSVWVRTGLLPYIRGVQVTSVGTGIMRYLGNKGVASMSTPLHCVRWQTTQAYVKG